MALYCTVMYHEALCLRIVKTHFGLLTVAKIERILRESTRCKRAGGRESYEWFPCSGFDRSAFRNE